MTQAATLCVQVRLLREPEAAALTYALDVRGDERVMVFDLGGGTFDVSIVDVGGGVVEVIATSLHLNPDPNPDPNPNPDPDPNPNPDPNPDPNPNPDQVIATSGDPRVGGNDWDLVITDWLEEQYRAQHGVPLRGLAYRRVLDAAVEAKHALSLSATTVIEVPFLDGERGLGPITLSRRKFEALCRPLLLKLVPPLKEPMESLTLALALTLTTLTLALTLTLTLTLTRRPWSSPASSCSR